MRCPRQALKGNELLGTRRGVSQGWSGREESAVRPSTKRPTSNETVLEKLENQRGNEVVPR